MDCARKESLWCASIEMGHPDIVERRNRMAHESSIGGR
jgi:hypothetical protein